MDAVYEPEWVEFSRADAGAVIDMVRAVAEARDPGAHGDGVEVVIEAPRLRWLARLWSKIRLLGAGRLGPGRWIDADGRPDQARIIVTKHGGEVTYPFDVQLVTDEGGRAARKIPVRPGWARSNSAGVAFAIQKGRAGAPYSWGDLVGGAIAALMALRGNAPDEGWRARIEDRSVG
jgi:hypothetical protein